MVDWPVEVRTGNQAAPMRYLVATAVTMAMLTGPAHSQMSMSSPDTDPLLLKYAREAREKAENEKAYNATMQRLKGQPPAAASSDPWKTVRPASEPAANKR